MADKLKDALKSTPGFERDWVHESLVRHGVGSWEQLGSMDEEVWRWVLDQLPAMRVEVPDDLTDPNRLGPGHFNSLDEIRKEARQEFVKIKGKRERKQRAEVLRRRQAREAAQLLNQMGIAEDADAEEV